MKALQVRCVQLNEHMRDMIDGVLCYLFIIPSERAADATTHARGDVTFLISGDLSPAAVAGSLLAWKEYDFK